MTLLLVEFYLPAPVSAALHSLVWVVAFHSIHFDHLGVVVDLVAVGDVNTVVDVADADVAGVVVARVGIPRRGVAGSGGRG